MPPAQNAPLSGLLRWGFVVLAVSTLSGNKNALWVAKNAKFDLFLMRGQCTFVENGKIYKKSDS